MAKSGASTLHIRTGPSLSFSFNKFITIKPIGADTLFLSHSCADFFVVSWDKPMAPHRPLKGPMVFLQNCEEGFSGPCRTCVQQHKHMFLVPGLKIGLDGCRGKVFPAYGRKVLM